MPEQGREEVGNGNGKKTRRWLGGGRWRRIRGWYVCLGGGRREGWEKQLGCGEGTVASYIYIHMYRPQSHFSLPPSFLV